MKIILKIILLAFLTAAIAVVAEQLLAVFANIFSQGEVVFDSYPRLTWFLAASAVIEEVAKYSAIWFVIRKSFRLEKNNLVPASLLLGLVWGIFEAALAIYSNQTISLVSTVPLISLHTLTAFLMGTFISGSHDPENPPYIKIIAFSIFIHLLFNFLVIKLA